MPGRNQAELKRVRNPSSIVQISGRTWNDKIVPALSSRETSYRRPAKSGMVSPTVLVEAIQDRNIKPGDWIEIGQALPNATGDEDQDNAYIFEQIFQGNETSEDSRQYGVALEGRSSELRSDTLIEVAISGVVTANVKINDNAHTHAIQTDEDGQFESTFCPTRNRLLVNPGTGNGDLAKVELNSTADMIVCGVTLEEIQVNDEGRVRITGGHELVVQLDKLHGGQAISENKGVFVHYFASENICRIISADCEGSDDDSGGPGMMMMTGGGG